MKKLFLTLILITFLSINSVFANANYTSVTTTSSVRFATVTPFDKSSCQKFAEDIKLERAIIFNALQLSPEQAKYRYQILNNNITVLEDKFLLLYKEQAKLNYLKQNNEDKSLIKQQQKTVKSIQKDIKNFVKQENKDYKKILTLEQRAKLKEIQKLQQKSYKSQENKTDYYKLNPKMRPFAPHLQ